MFRELVALGKELEQAGELPSPGFYNYAEPIHWVVHLLPDGVHIEDAELRVARPFSGRTSAEEEHLLSDTAAYAVGVTKLRGGGEDGRADKKHQRFRALYRTFLVSDELEDRALREAIEHLELALENKWVTRHERYREMASEDWVSFVPEQGLLSGTHLFQHAQARDFWMHEMERRCTEESGENRRSDARGSCSVCGQEQVGLIRKLPLGVKLAKTTPLHSLNKDAFTSFIAGPATSKKAHLGVCYECGDTAARAFNFLSNSSQHRRDLLRAPKQKDKDKLSNQIALYWLRAPAPIRVEDAVLDLRDIDIGAILEETPSIPGAELSQLLALLKLPWSPTSSMLRLDDYGFFLGILSPNVGRVAIRDWIAVSLTKVKGSLATFLDGTRMVSVWGEGPKPVSVRTIVEAIGAGDPNLTRVLLRSAYTGTRPPLSLAVQAGRRLNLVLPNEASLRERQRRRGRDQSLVWGDAWPHALAAAIKLGLFYGTKEAETMTETNPLYRSKAYQCGRLLAVLEVAQQRHYYRRSRKELKTTIVSRSYGGAVTAPGPTLGHLWKVASTAHLPEAGQRINQEVEAISTTLVELGGMPTFLAPIEQAEFGLGFYHQRDRNRELFRSAAVEASLEDREEEKPVASE